jgi:hypothetical protein
VPAEGEVRIFPRNERAEEVVVGYDIKDATIRVAPWPFAVKSHVGYLVGYLLEGYQAVLEPVMVQYNSLTARLHSVLAAAMVAE